MSVDKNSFPSSAALNPAFTLMATAPRVRDLEMGVRDMAQAEAKYPGWRGRLLTDSVRGLENFAELFRMLTSSNGSIKVYCEVAELSQ